jgi:formamidopyrimidine-DNA glycosylase
MPELPDVQVFKEYVDATALHRAVETVHIGAADLLEDVSRSTLRRHLMDRPLTATRRHGKHLFVAVAGGERWLRLHFGMTGELTYYRNGDEPTHTALRLDFDDGYRLAYVIPRRLGAIGLVKDVDRFVEQRELGPDPLASEFDLRRFRELLEGRRGMVKSTLMNQRLLAGLGNVYTDETLFQAGVHPGTPTDELQPETIRRLYRAMRRVLERAIAARARPERMPRSFLLTRRQAGSRCPRCGGTIEKLTLSGRSSYVCSRHQPEH